MILVFKNVMTSVKDFLWIFYKLLTNKFAFSIIYTTYRRGRVIMDITDFSLELDVTEVSTEQGYVSGGVTSTGCCKD